MAYFIHNKYDKASIDALAAFDTTANTVVDYYGDYETYKYLDTSAGFGILYDALSYVTPGTIIHDGQSDKDNSHFNFQSSIVIKSIQRGLFQTSGTEDPTVISIAAIDPTKSQVIINEEYRSNNGAYGVSLYALEANALYLKRGNKSTSYQVDGSYQVIEFC